MRAAAQAARAALADPQALAAAGPGATAVAAGGVAVSRQAGLYAHYMDGQAITPILHLPGGKLETGPPPLSLSNNQGGSESLASFDSKCDDQLAEHITICKANAAMYGGGKGGYSRAEIRRECFASAQERYSECLAGKKPRPLFTGRFIK